MFETDKPEDLYFTWEAFVKYIASLGNRRSGNNRHWGDYWQICLPCHVNYDYITHLDQNDNPALLRKLGVDNLIEIDSKYSWAPADKDELKWKTIPRSSAIKIYQKYFADFVIFGYSTNDVIPFINASDPNLGKSTTIYSSDWREAFIFICGPT